MINVQMIHVKSVAMFILKEVNPGFKTLNWQLPIEMQTMPQWVCTRVSHLTTCVMCM